MKSFCFALCLALIVYTNQAFGSESGMPQLNPEFFFSQLFWLVITFSFLLFYTFPLSYFYFYTFVFLDFLPTYPPCPHSFFIPLRLRLPLPGLVRGARLVVPQPLNNGTAFPPTVAAAAVVCVWVRVNSHFCTPASLATSMALPCNSICGSPDPVSYTHLTLPTNREV